MPIEGSLRDFGLQDVLQLLELARKTGVLVVRAERRDDDGELHFDRGQVVHARWGQTSRRLGRQLLLAGKVTERELRRALEIQAGDGSQRIGRILLEMGSVPREEIERQLRFQIEEAVFELLAWQDGQFRFEERESVGLGDPEARVRIETLLMEGARRIDEWARLESRIPSADSIPVLAQMAADGNTAPLDLHPEDWEVMAEVDGERNLREIAAALGRSGFDVARIVFGLVSTGIVQIEDRPSRPSEQELEEAIGEIRRLLEHGQPEEAGRLAAELQAALPERAELALLEGRALMAQDRMRAATEAFARAVGLEPLEKQAHYHLGFAAARIGEFGRASRAFEAYLRLDPDRSRGRAVSRALEAIRELDRIMTSEAG